MNYDEAERIASQIKRTIPDNVVRVLKVEHNAIAGSWQVKCDELGPASGAKGRGIIVWLQSIPEWMRLQRYWSKLAEAQTLDTIYTVLEDKGVGGFYALILTPSARIAGKPPSQMAYFDDPGEASQEVKASYGQDAVYVEPEQFSKIAEGL